MCPGSMHRLSYFLQIYETISTDTHVQILLWFKITCCTGTGRHLNVPFLLVIPDNVQNVCRPRISDFVSSCMCQDGAGTRVGHNLNDTLFANRNTLNWHSVSCFCAPDFINARIRTCVFVVFIFYAGFCFFCLSLNEFTNTTHEYRRSPSRPTPLIQPSVG